MSKPRKTPAAVCPACKKTVRVLPAGGDWTNEISLCSHRNKAGDKCSGRFHTVPDSKIIWPPNF